MRAVGIIPARWGSSRFPGKAITPIAGRPMIRWVWERARTAKRLRELIVATDDERIARVCRDFGARVAMTRANHRSGTDRLGEVAATLDDDILVNVQGDEPLIEGFVIDAVVDALAEDSEAVMATAVHLVEPDDLADPNRTKAVVDERGRCVSFSRRSPEPTAAPTRVFQHVGLYAYRREFLQQLIALPPTRGELEESLEQLRALEHGHAIHAAVVEGWRSLPVDVPADVARVETALARQRQRGEL
jgi:3-deoxy-manno-octulosonate cytidylyltransferase (CMP-KDO synthetase)